MEPKGSFPAALKLIAVIDIQWGEIADPAVAALAWNHGMMDVGAGDAEDMPWVLSSSNASVNTHYS